MTKATTVWPAPGTRSLGAESSGRHLPRLLISAGIIAGLGSPLLAQKLSSLPSAYTASLRVPPALREQFKALGDRLVSPGKERIVLSGVLSTSSGDTPLHVVMERGGKLRVDWTGSTARSLGFDGANRWTSKGSVTAEDGDLLESLVDDWPDTLMDAAARGAGYRLLGRRYRDSSGGLCDYYDTFVAAKTRSKPDRPVKRYCFDSTTLLPRQVEYARGSGAAAQLSATRFSQWSTVNGQAVPGQVIRVQGGKTVFTFRIQQASVAASAADGLFAGGSGKD